MVIRVTYGGEDNVIIYNNELYYYYLYLILYINTGNLGLKILIIFYNNRRGSS